MHIQKNMLYICLRNLLRVNFLAFKLGLLASCDMTLIKPDLSAQLTTDSLSAILPNTDNYGLFDLSFSSFQSSVPPTRYVNNPILENDGTYTNTAPSGIIRDPADSSKFLFYLAEFLGFTTVGSRISLHEGVVSDPYGITTDNGVMLAGSESYDTNGCRLGAVACYRGTVYFYYAGVDASYKWRICLATSTDGRTFNKQGVVLDFNDTDEKSVSDPSIIIEGGTWYMIYTSWDGLSSPANNNPGESTIGIRLATSTDGTTWTKTGTTLIPLGADGEIDDNKVEGATLRKFGDTYVICYNANDGDEWRIAYASSTVLNQVFTKQGEYFRADVNNSGAWDERDAAVPLFEKFGNNYVFYYQGGPRPNPNQEEDIGAADL